MRALDAYRGVRRELDKNASASFSVRDFNYFFNNAVKDYCSENYSLKDLRQKEDDDLRMVLEYDKDLGVISANSADLPADYKHTLGVRVLGTFVTAVDEFIVGQQVTFNEVHRMRSGSRGIENAYKEPSHRKVYHRIAGSKMYIETGLKVQVTKIYLDYLKTASTVFLNPDTSVNFDQEANNTTILFPDDVVREIIGVCARIFLENIESPRYRTSLQEKQLRQE